LPLEWPRCLSGAVPQSEPGLQRRCGESNLSALKQMRVNPWRVRAASPGYPLRNISLTSWRPVPRMIMSPQSQEIPMRKFILTLILGLAAGLSTAQTKSIYDFTMKSIDGDPVSLSSFKGKVVLLVNVASKCGFTPQYTALEAIYEKYKDRGFVIVGVPANNFMQQEPGTNEEIKTFCSRKYNVTFPMMSKVSVKGDDKTPLYQYLTDPAQDAKFSGDIKWNFTKFLVDRNGMIVARFEPATTPDAPEVQSAIESALK
jgi:glutathione peroxidase